MSYEEAEHRVQLELASLSGTNPEDWYLTFKARYGMAVVLQQLAKNCPSGTVVTQAFTCLTAVNPIIQVGLKPRYVDIEESTLMIDPSLLHFNDKDIALVMQHTFGIMAENKSRQLTQIAKDAGVLLIEDSAHCLTQMTRDNNGTPLADISLHSFGVEKVLPTHFGGAIYVNPNMADRGLHQMITDALKALPNLPKQLSAVSRAYPIQNGILNRIPGSLGPKLRNIFTSKGLMEPPIAPLESTGTLPHPAYKPSIWMLDKMCEQLRQIREIKVRRRTSVAAFLDATQNTDAMVPSAMKPDEPLVRFPMFAKSEGAAVRAINAVNASGHFAGHWYCPLLFPGVTSDSFNFDPEGTDLPVTRSLASRTLNFQTTNSPQNSRRIAEIATHSLNQLPAKNSDLGNKDFVPIFLGTGLGAYNLARSLHEEYKIKSLALGRAALDETAQSSILETRVYPQFGDPKFVVETLCALEKEFAGKKLLLIPTIEFYTNVVSDNRDSLSDVFLIPLPNKELVDKLIDKRQFYKTCEEVGFPYPETTFISRKTYQLGWSADTLNITYPVIVKPSDTDTYQRVIFEGRKKVYKAENREELDSIVALIYGSEYCQDLVIQQFLRGREEVMRVANTYCDKNGKTRLVSVGQVILTELNPSLVGNNNAIATVADPTLVEKIKNFLDQVGYVGLANFDFMLDTKTGQYKVLEVNLRAGATSFYTMPSGGTLAKYAVEDLVYDRELPMLETKKETVWVNVPKPILLGFTSKHLKQRFNVTLQQETTHTLDYAPDQSLLRRLKIARHNAKHSLDYLRYSCKRLND